MRYFASDNFAGVHPAVMDALSRANDGHATAYGGDSFTKNVEEKLGALFGGDARAVFVYNGTGANVVALRCLLRPFEAVICPQTAHINIDECGAPEWMTGSKLITLPTRDGKLTVEQFRSALHGFGNEHHVQPKVLAISQATEYGTLYALDELRTLVEIAHQHGLYTYVDGARIANAAAALRCTLEQMVTDTGVDVVSFGGTKNGTMFGEAIVFIRKELARDAHYYRKQSAQLASKMRYIAAQYEALLSDGLWLKNAEHANRMASLLQERVRSVPGVAITQPVQVNSVFARIPKHVIGSLQAKSFFWTWDEAAGEVRWMTSWDTTIKDIDEFAAMLAEAINAPGV